MRVKKILFLGRKEDQEAFSNLIRGHEELQLSTAKNVRKLSKILKEDEPDFVLFAGEIQLNPDGTYSILF